MMIAENFGMNRSVTVVLAREDLSVPGAAVTALPRETAFFDLVNRSNPDVIVLDLSRASADGASTIMTIRQRTEVPILAACPPDPSLVEQYRIAGAADCIAAPVEITRLNQAIQRILQLRARPGPASSGSQARFRFEGLSFHSEHSVLATEDGTELGLTRSECRLLAHFVTRPWSLCTHSELAGLLYGNEQGVRRRAIDVDINCLRKKLGSAGILKPERLIRTEPRRGYLLAADVRGAAA